MDVLKSRDGTISGDVWSRQQAVRMVLSAKMVVFFP